MREFSKTMAFMGLFTPFGANALGVGEIRLHSALNQVLDADIPLIASAVESSSEIRVSLASPGAFAKAGLERPFYLSGLRFTPVKKGNRVVVKVTSRDVIREPFLNFLVEVNWPQGRMLREFTVLLDPPATFKTPANPVVSAPVTQSKTVTQSRFAVDSPSNYGFKSRTPASRRPSPPRPQNRDYVRSRRNDTLWGLASRANRGSLVSQEQMMIALYEANPQAFFKKNVNALKAGYKLKIPSADALKKYSRREALAEFNRQNVAWSGKVESKPEVAANKPVVKSSATVATGSSKESSLKLISPSEGETVSSSASSAPAKDQTRGAELAMEMAETVSQENDELRSRMKLIEQQLAKMQEMLALKDKQLAALASKGVDVAGALPADRIVDMDSGAAAKAQTDAAEDGLKPSLPDSAVAPPISVATGVQPGLGTPADPVLESTTEGMEPVDPTQAPTELPSVSEIEGSSGSEIVTPDSDTQPSPQDVGSVPDLSEAVPAIATPEAVSAPKARVSDDANALEPENTGSVPEQIAEQGLLEELLDEPYYLAAAGGGVILLGLLAWMLVRRRNNIAMVEAESILSAEERVREVPDESTDADNSATTAPDEIGIAAESSFLSEFTPSDFDALETEHDDVDPVSEADVYLAYGRYQQAEDLIRNAIENYPDRDECKLKLLEIHYATEDRESYESYAHELEGMKTENPDFWAKVAEMGREICPQSDLFGDSASPSSSEYGGSLDEPDEGAAVFAAEDLDGPGSGTDTAVEGESDFNFNVEIPDTSAAETGEEPLGGSFLPEDEGSNSDQPQPLEFPVGIEESKDSGSTEEEELAGETETFAMDEGTPVVMDFNVETEPADQAVETAPLAQTEQLISTENDNGLDFNLDFSADTVESEPSEPTDADVYDLTDMDEIETKLDLAKAYVEMDDQDSARDILSEILVQGNDEQKIEAQALVDVLENKA